MAFWNRKAPQTIEERATLEDILLGASIDASLVTKEQAMSVPSLSACVNMISDTVASLPIKLYKEKDGQVESVEDDRVSLLNDDTKDTLDGFQFKKALIEDYLLEGNGYAYINRQRNKVRSLHFIDCKNVSVQTNADPIHKQHTLLVQSGRYQPWEFIKLTRKTKDGITGKGVVTENNKIFSVAYNGLIFEEMLVRTGGNKKGFLKAQGRLSTDAITELKNAWNNLYKNNSDNVVVLNNGLEFQEANNSSVEMQVNQNKITNSREVFKIFAVSPGLLEGKASEVDHENFIKLSILPILKAFETALNKDLLLDKEKGKLFFAFDVADILKGDIEKRYKAYEIAVKNGILQVDEVRYLENYASLGLDFIKLGLQDVLYNPKTKEIYTPNTNQTNSIEAPKPASGETLPAETPVEEVKEKDESGDKE